jgi:hypothetical protein
MVKRAVKGPGRNVVGEPVEGPEGEPVAGEGMSWTPR